MPGVRLEGLRKTFGGTVAVRDISITFKDGEMTSVLGPSGCGKSTTLNLIAGFIEPDAGAIFFDDRLIADAPSRFAVPPERRDLGMVFQSYALWPHLSVGENVAYGLKMRRVARAEREKAAQRALERVRLGKFADRYPHELSGGQQQRVALARALAYSPQILLFDEPLSNLDARLREEMRIELKNIHRSVGVTAIYVTHDQAEAMAISDTVVVMSDGEIVQVGSPRELYEEPADVRVARFIGRANILDAVLIDGRATSAQAQVTGMDAPIGCRTRAGVPQGARGALSIRQEGISLRPRQASAGLRGRISAVLYLGMTSQYRVALGTGQELEAMQVAADGFAVGDEVALEIDPRRAYFIAGVPQHAETTS